MISINCEKAEKDHGEIESRCFARGCECDCHDLFAPNDGCTYELEIVEELP
jgi:hypothetical protein